MAMFSGVLLGQMQPIQQAAKKGVSPSSDRNCTKSFTRDRPPAVLHDSVHEEITLLDIVNRDVLVQSLLRQQWYSRLLALPLKMLRRLLLSKSFIRIFGG